MLSLGRLCERLSGQSQCLWFWRAQRRQTHLVVSSKVQYHVPDSDFRVCVWVGAVGPFEWHLAAALGVCLCVSNAVSGSSVRECNSNTSHLALRKRLHTAVHYTVRSAHSTCLHVCDLARSHTRIDTCFRACEWSNLCCFSFPVHTLDSAC